MNEYDCLLLEHVFGNRPDDSHKVRAYVLDTIASDPGLQQTELVFLGLFGRSCNVLQENSQASRRSIPMVCQVVRPFDCLTLVLGFCWIYSC